MQSMLEVSKPHDVVRVVTGWQPVGAVYSVCSSSFLNISANSKPHTLLDSAKSDEGPQDYQGHTSCTRRLNAVMSLYYL